MDDDEYPNFKSALFKSTWGMIISFFGKENWESFLYEQLGKSCIINDIEAFRNVFNHLFAVKPYHFTRKGHSMPSIV